MIKRLPILFLLTLLAFSACTEEPVVDDGGALGVYIQCPGFPETRAEEGEVPGCEAESALHSLFVWVFDSDTHLLIGSLDLSGSQLPVPGQVRRYDLTVTREFSRTKPEVDVFAIANAASMGCTLNAESTWDEVNDAVFTDPYFGVETPVRTVDASLGLPMTGAGRNLTVQGEEPLFRVETVRLTRAVSRIRFVFCRMANEHGEDQDEVFVRKVTLNGQMIPETEYLFLSSPSESYHFVPNDYDLLPLNLSGPGDLAPNDMPEKLVYAGQGASSYEKLLDDAVEEGKLTDWGKVYLRESNKMLTGYVDYVINGEESTRTFSMAAPGDFVRNRTWTLYGYFLSGRNLQLSIRALPWDYNKWNINFSNESVQADQLSVDAGSVELTQTGSNSWDARLRPGSTAKCSVHITSPASGKLMIRPIGDTYAFIVEPEIADINPDYNSGTIDISIRQNPDAPGNLSGKFITLSFYVELGEREIEANSEILPDGKVYRFIL